VNDIAWHESGSAWTELVPFFIHNESDPAFDDVKCFVLIQVIMRRRTATGRRDFGPHRELSSRAFAIEMNSDFLAKRMQHLCVILANDRT
jgi:hypothetical protein